MFYEHVALTASDKKWFSNDISSIRWQYALKPENSYIPAATQELYCWEEIAVLEVELHETSHVQRLAEIIHRGIPYPLLLLFLDENATAASATSEKVCILSVAEKRDAQSGKQASRLHRLWISEAISETQLNEDTPAYHFLTALSFTQQPRLNMQAFYESWIRAFSAHEASAISGRFQLPDGPEARKQQQQTLDELRSMQQQMQALRARLRNAEAFSKKVQLNMEIKALETKLKEVTHTL